MKPQVIKPGTQFILLEPYPCKYCGIRFSDSRKLEKHEFGCYAPHLDYRCFKSDRLEKYHSLKETETQVLENCKEYQCQNCGERSKFEIVEGRAEVPVRDR